MHCTLLLLGTLEDAENQTVSIYDCEILFQTHIEDFIFVFFVHDVK